MGPKAQCPRISILKHKGFYHIKYHQVWYTNPEKPLLLYCQAVY